MTRSQLTWRDCAKAGALTLAFGALGPFSALQAQTDPPIVRPGAPGQPSRQISAEEASDLTGIEYTEADVKFMQGMIAHHAQAITMTDFLTTRSQQKEMQDLGKRIALSQEDEIKMMQEWLGANDQDVPALDAHHGHDGMLMPGMLTVAQLKRLEDTDGVDFDRLFLELMIAHHQGALLMVDELLATPGAAQESTIFGFTSDVTSDQSMEIDRMGGMLAGLSDDPRVYLTAGFRDAGQALANLELVAAIPKPTGFFSPERPEGLAIPKESGEEESEEEAESSAESEAADSGDTESDDAESGDGESDGETEAEESEETDEEAKRAELRARMSAILNFANSDMAFSGDVLFEGNFHGFNTYNIEDPTVPRLQGSVVCPGGQGDVSVVGDLLIMSVEQTRGRLDCGREGVAETG